MNEPKFTKQRVMAAFAVAAVADALQFPVTAATLTGFLAVPGEFTELAIDLGVMAATTTLLGFHWALLPSLFAELVPVGNLFPTWTACVAFVVWRRKKEQSSSIVVDVQEVLPPLLSDAPPGEKFRASEKLRSRTQSHTPEK